MRLLLLFVCIQGVLVKGGKMVLCPNVQKVPLNLTGLAGTWYETIRVPKIEAMRCLKVQVPPKAGGNLELQLDYVSTVKYEEAKRVKETITFPMDNYTKNGNFRLHYKTSKMPILVTYKLVFTNFKSLTTICGFSGVSKVPLYKVFSREPTLGENETKFIMKQFNEAGLDEFYMMTDQSPDYCDTAERLTAEAIYILAILWRLLH